MDKCDSLRVAYVSQVGNINELVQLNLKYYNNIQANIKSKEKLQLELDESLKALRKKKKGNWILPTAIGITGGLLGGVLLVK